MSVYLACWLSPARIHLPPAVFRLLASCSLWLACLFSLACWLSPAGIHLPPADFRLLASCSRLLAVGCCLLQASTIAIARIQHIGGRGRGRGKGRGRGRGRGRGNGKGRGRGILDSATLLSLPQRGKAEARDRGRGKGRGKGRGRGRCRFSELLAPPCNRQSGTRPAQKIFLIFL